MFRTILVPLDGSRLAEQALPLALSVARRAKADLRLALVHLQDFRGSQADAALSRTERAYLDATANRIRQLGGPPVTSEILEKSPVTLALCDHARETGADLMVLTTHGRGPLSRFWLGSIADGLLRQAAVPLLIQRPTEGAPFDLNTDYPFRRILVPLDGSEIAEAALAPAAELARIMGGELTLLRAVEVLPVVAPDGIVYSTPAFDAIVVEELTMQARQYLDRTATRLRADGLHVSTCVTTAEPVAASILRAAESADLIALATHGRGRVARFFLGSVADKVVRGALCPVLVCRNPSVQ